MQKNLPLNAKARSITRKLSISGFISYQFLYCSRKKRKTQRKMMSWYRSTSMESFVFKFFLKSWNAARRLPVTQLNGNAHFYSTPRISDTFLYSSNRNSMSLVSMKCTVHARNLRTIPSVLRAHKANQVSAEQIFGAFKLLHTYSCRENKAPSFLSYDLKF